MYSMKAALLFMYAHYLKHLQACLMDGLTLWNHQSLMLSLEPYGRQLLVIYRQRTGHCRGFYKVSHCYLQKNTDIACFIFLILTEIPTFFVVACLSLFENTQTLFWRKHFLSFTKYMMAGICITQAIEGRYPTRSGSHYLIGLVLT